MTSGQSTSPPAMFQAATLGQHGSKPAPTGRWLEGTIFFFLALFAILLPHSIKGAQHAWQIALVLWLLKLALERSRPYAQPLTAPLLAYVVLSAISTLLSPDPYMSWAAMKRVCLVMVGILVAQNLTRLSQVRILVILLLLSGLAAAGFTAWQYSYGIGVRVQHIDRGSALYGAGVRTGDVIARVDRRNIHTATQWESAIGQCRPGSILRIDLLRGLPLHWRQRWVACEALRSDRLRKENLQLVRGKPVRAQGTLGHYGIFAETLMPVGCLAWAMAFSTHKARLRVLFAIIFLSLAVTIIATESRAAIAGLAAGCFVVVMLLAGRRVRIWATALLALLLAAATFWIHRARGLNWIAVQDAGTRYRLLMWEDGMRLVRQHPWFGIGMDTIFNHWQEWNIRAYALYHVQYNFHSDIVQLAVERGLPALAAWLWFLIANLIFLSGLLRRVQSRSRFATGAAAGALAGFVAFLLPSLVEYSLHDETLMMLLFFFFGMAVAMDRMLHVPGAIDVP